MAPEERANRLWTVNIDSIAQRESSLPAGRVDERTRDAIRILVPPVKELSGAKP